VKVGRYLVIFLFIMALLIAFGNNGLIDNLIMKEKLNIMKDANVQLAAENNQLKREISLLRNSPHHIESSARNELGMVRNNELIYKFAE
jgi:cell division protein FtsB